MMIKHWMRLPFLALGMLSLLAALWGGLIRLGWEWLPGHPMLVMLHGPLMVSGFLGTLIGVERAVALGHRWAYVASLLSGAGALLLITGVSYQAGTLLITLGSLVLVLIFAQILRRQREFCTVVTGSGSVLWVIGNTLWLAGWPVHQMVFWWIGFLLLTIAGERLELSRLQFLSPGKQLFFLGAGGLFLFGLLVKSMGYNQGTFLLGGGLFAMALWLWHFDIARRTVWTTGLTRFIAISLLSGYVWLGTSGILALSYRNETAGLYYDAFLHTFFAGFVLSMIFGHAPIIFPAVLGVPVLFHSTFYTHLVVLHGSLLLRIIGDLIGWLPGRQWGGLLNGVAVVLFLANTVYAGQKAIHKPRLD